MSKGLFRAQQSPELVQAGSYGIGLLCDKRRLTQTRGGYRLLGGDRFHHQFAASSRSADPALRALLQQHALSVSQELENVIGATASGFLIKPDVFVTAGHCIKTKNIFGSLLAPQHIAVVFGFFSTIDKPIFSSSQVFFVDRVLDGQYSPMARRSRDYAVLKLTRPVVDHQPLPCQWAVPRYAGPVILLGHPYGLPMTRMEGSWMGHESAGYFAAALPSLAGSSGSPVLDQKQRVLGLLSGAQGHYENDFVTTSEGLAFNLHCRCSNRPWHADRCACPGVRITPASSFARFAA